MAVKEGRLPVGASTDLNLDTTIVTQTDGVKAHRETVVLGDPEINGARIKFEGFPFGIEERWAIPITGMELKTLCDAMERMIEGQRLTHLYLSRLVGEELSTDDLEDY